MIPFFLWLALNTSVKGVISIATDNFKNIETYTVTIYSRQGADREVVKYSYKAPGYARMEFTGPNEGDVLVYNPVRKEARLLPRGGQKPFVVTLEAGNKLIQSRTGRALQGADMGTLLKKIERLQANGTIELFGEDVSGKRPAVKVKVLGAYGYEADGVNVYMLWLDKMSLFPVRVMAYDAKGNLVEDLLMDDMVINPALPANLFRLE